MERKAYCKSCDNVVCMEAEELKQTNTGKLYYQGNCNICNEVLYSLPLEDTEIE